MSRHGVLPAPLPSQCLGKMQAWHEDRQRVFLVCLATSVAEFALVHLTNIIGIAPLVVGPVVAGWQVAVPLAFFCGLRARQALGGSFKSVWRGRIVLRTGFALALVRCCSVHVGAMRLCRCMQVRCLQSLVCGLQVPTNLHGGGVVEVRVQHAWPCLPLLQLHVISNAVLAGVYTGDARPFHSVRPHWPRAHAHRASRARDRGS